MKYFVILYLVIGLFVSGTAFKNLPRGHKIRLGEVVLAPVVWPLIACQFTITKN